MRPKRTCLFLFRLSAALFALLIFLRFLFCCTIFSTCRPFFSSCFLLDHHCRNDRCCNHRNDDNHNNNRNNFSYFFVIKIHFSIPLFDTPYFILFIAFLQQSLSGNSVLYVINGISTYVRHHSMDFSCDSQKVPFSQVSKMFLYVSFFSSDFYQIVHNLLSIVFPFLLLHKSFSLLLWNA